MGWTDEKDGGTPKGEIKKIPEADNGQRRLTMAPVNVDQELKAKAREMDRLAELAGSVDTNLEREIAEKLYNREDVREAGQEALSRISTLLIRYNRLKDAEKRTILPVEQERAKALKKIEEEEAELLNNSELSDSEKKEAYKALQERKKQINEKADKEITSLTQKSDDPAENAKYANAQNEQMMSLRSNINTDNSGGILSTLLLGGNAMGSKGYTLTSGSVEDLAKGSTYIKDVSGERGNLFSQMSLLDNAVNTSGVSLSGHRYDLGKPQGWGLGKNQADPRDTPKQEDWIGSSVNGAKYSLGDILRNISDQDVQKMEMASGQKMGIDMDALKQTREQGNLDNEIGSRKGQVSIAEAAGQRGISEESMLRQQGKMGGVNDLLKEEGLSKDEIKRRKGILKQLEDVGRGKAHKQVQGFWGSLFSKSSYSRGGSQEERRRNRRAAREEWQERMKYAALRRARIPFRDRAGRVVAPVKPGINMNDTAEKSLPKMDSDEDQAARLMMGGSQDKSARNMIAAYKLIGATPKELYEFRLALIAYMVPAGKKTLMQIMRESEEAGYKGNEDLSSMESLYRTYLDAPIVEGVYVNNFKKKQPTLEALKLQKSLQLFKKDKAEAVLAEQQEAQDDKKKLEAAKGKQGSLSTLKELKKKEQDRKDKKTSRLQKWITAEVATINEADEEEELSEDYTESAPKDKKEEVDDVGDLGSLFGDEEEKKEEPEKEEPKDQKAQENQEAQDEQKEIDQIEIEQKEIEQIEIEQTEQEYAGEFDNLDENALDWEDDGSTVEQMLAEKPQEQDPQVEEQMQQVEEELQQAEEQPQEIEQQAEEQPQQIEQQVEEQAEEEIEEIIEYDDEELDRIETEKTEQEYAGEFEDFNENELMFDEVLNEGSPEVASVNVAGNVGSQQTQQRQKVRSNERIRLDAGVLESPGTAPASEGPEEEIEEIIEYDAEELKRQKEEAAAKAEAAKAANASQPKTELSYMDSWKKFRELLTKSNADLDAKKVLADNIKLLENMLDEQFVIKNHARLVAFNNQLVIFEGQFQTIAQNAKDLIQKLDEAGNQHEALKKLAYRIGGKAVNSQSSFKKNAQKMIVRLRQEGVLNKEKHSWGEVMGEAGNISAKNAGGSPQAKQPKKTIVPPKKQQAAAFKNVLAKKSVPVLQQMEIQEQVSEEEVNAFFADYQDDEPKKSVQKSVQKDVEEIQEELEKTDPVYRMLVAHIGEVGKEQRAADIYKSFTKILKSDSDCARLAADAQVTEQEVTQVLLAYKGSILYPNGFREKAMGMIRGLLK